MKNKEIGDANVIIGDATVITIIIQFRVEWGLNSNLGNPINCSTGIRLSISGIHGKKNVLQKSALNKRVFCHF